MELAFTVVIRANIPKSVDGSTLDIGIDNLNYVTSDGTIKYIELPSESLNLLKESFIVVETQRIR